MMQIACQIAKHPACHIYTSITCQITSSSTACHISYHLATSIDLPTYITDWYWSLSIVYLSQLFVTLIITLPVMLINTLPVISIHPLPVKLLVQLPSTFLSPLLLRLLSSITNLFQIHFKSILIISCDSSTISDNVHRSIGLSLVCLCTTSFQRSKQW